MANKPQGTWYVSFETPRQERRKFARLTETFTSEREAKQFARAKLVHTQSITAGTLNSYQPRRTVNPLQVPDWVEEPDGTNGVHR
jgi:hypothetical protein